VLDLIFDQNAHLWNITTGRHAHALGQQTDRCQRVAHFMHHRRQCISLLRQCLFSIGLKLLSPERRQDQVFVGFLHFLLQAFECGGFLNRWKIRHCQGGADQPLVGLHQ